MTKRRAVQGGMLAWAVIGSAIALSSLRTVNADAGVFVGVASVVGPLAAVAASRMIAHEAERLAAISSAGPPPPHRRCPPSPPVPETHRPKSASGTLTAASIRKT